METRGYFGNMRNLAPLAAAIAFSFVVLACVDKPAPATDRQSAVAEATPAKQFTAKDIARLKWIEGTWRGLDGDKPFFERYKIEDNAMVVESLNKDGVPTGEPERFELKNGEFGKDEGDKRSAASEITDDHVQFVPAVPGKQNRFRFERQANGTWRAVLDWPAKAGKPAGEKIYIMEPWKP